MRSHYFNLFRFVLCVTVLWGSGSDVYAQYPGFDEPGTRTSGGGAAGLVPVESQVDGGSIPTGATSQVVVLFRNEGAQPVETGKINLYPSSNISANVSLNQCVAEPLPAGAECAIAISVKGLQAGAWRLEMLMLHSGRTRLVTATLTGSIEVNGDATDTLASDVETIPDEVDFGSLATSQTLIEPVILRNITSNPIALGDIYIKSAERSGYTVEHECDTLQAGQACVATVKWAPKQRGPSTGVLVVKHDGPTGVASVALSGDYAPDDIDEALIFPEAVPGKGLLVSSQTEIDFGDEIVSASTITVSLVNAGDSPLTINEIKLSGSDNGISISENGCSAKLVLDPIEACPLTLNWSPARVGSVLDDVQILHDGARGVLVIPVRGQSDAVVSKDQGAIVLESSSEPTRVIGNDDVANEDRERSKPRVSARANVANAASALDGLKITSFAATRAIVNGPGGSRLIYDNEEVVLGGVTWDVSIQKNGIEFSNGADRVLLLFDRSLSSLNRISAQSGSSGASSSGSSDDGG